MADFYVMDQRAVGDSDRALVLTVCADIEEACEDANDLSGAICSEDGTVLWEYFDARCSLWRPRGGRRSEG